jgi:hypothetical protein
MGTAQEPRHRNRRRAAAAAAAAVGVLLALSPAAASAADSITISPTSGPVGTTISFSGFASSCAKQEGGDAEVFFLVGNFAGDSTVNPRTKVELGADGAFQGTFAAPDPLDSADPRAPKSGVKSYAVSVRCLGPDGEHNGGQIVNDPPAFTFTDLVPIAHCDVYWVKPGHTLNAKAPGVFANDSDPRGLSFKGKIDKINFGLSSHSYTFTRKTGALRFTPGANATKAVFTYHITNSRQVSSRPTKATVYVQSKKPSSSKLNACN